MSGDIFELVALHPSFLRLKDMLVISLTAHESYDYKECLACAALWNRNQLNAELQTYALICASLIPEREREREMVK